MLRRIASTLVACILAVNAWGQSTPNFPSFPAKNPTAAEWNGYFGAKVDTNGGKITNPTITGGTLNNVTLNNPTLNNVIYSGTTTFSGGLISSGSTTLSGGGSISGIYAGAPTLTGVWTFNGGGVLNGTFSGPTYLSNAKINLTPFTIGTLPASPAPGDMIRVTDCLNGQQTVGFGTGCVYFADNNSVWQPMPTIPTLTITVGGQGLFLGGTSANQGNGNRLQLATSATPGIAGQCAQFDSNLNIVPAGAGCGSGGGGSGTVSAGTANQLATYASTGSTVSGLATANNAVLVTNGSGVPSESTTLPSALSIPSPSITTGMTLFGTSTSSVQGNGLKVQLSTGSATTGHCVQFDANGNTVDAGGACTTTGASGTVTSSPANQIAFYSSTGSTVVGFATANNAVVVTNGSGVPSESTTLPSSLTIPSSLLTTAVSLFGTSTTAVQGGGAKIQLSTGTATNGHCVQFDATGNTVDAGGACTVGGGGGTVTSGTLNQLAYYSSSGTAVAGLATANNAVLVTNGSGAPSESTTLPSALTIPSPLVTTGLTLFGTATSAVQGNATKIQLASGTTTSGHCASYDASGNLIDAGGACGGGSGVVSSGTANQVAIYSASGTTVSGLTTANNAVLVTNGSGVPSEATTLPSGITGPTMTLSNPVITGAGTYVALTGSGKLTTTASAAGGSGLNLPQGAAPTSPNNGDVWQTSAGLFNRANGATFGPLIDRTGVSATSPVTYNNGTGVFACATCATTTNGGALTATSPMAISAAGVISLGTLVGVAEFFADSTVPVHNDTYPLPSDTWPWATGTIDSVTYYTSGTSTPSFSIALQINGTNVTSCSGIVVSSATRTTTTCTGANTITSGQHPTLVISGTSGTPNTSLVQINFHHSNP